MAGRAWIAMLLVTAGLTGCLGGTDGSDVSTMADRGNATVTPEQAQGSPDRISTVDCNQTRAQVSQLIRSHSEDPLGERANATPGLVTCPEQGVFYLAAYGLQGEALTALTWTVPQETTCSGYLAGGSDPDGSHHYQVSTWEQPDGSTRIGGGYGGGGLIVSAFAGPVDSNQIAGFSGWGSWGSPIEERPFAAGSHRYTIADSAWGPTSSPATDGAAFLLMIACDGTFRFDGASSSDTLEMFDARDMDTGAGARAFLAGGASAGRALDTTLETPGVLKAISFSGAAAGTALITDKNGTERATFHAEKTVGLHRPVPAGPLTVELTTAGRFTNLVGAAHGPLEAIDVATILGAEDQGPGT